MTYEDYLLCAEPEHGTVVEYWSPLNCGSYVSFIRCTYHKFTAWSDHPWSKNLKHITGADFEDEWAIEIGDSPLDLRAGGRSEPGWSALRRILNDSERYATRREALAQAAQQVSTAREYHEAEARRLRNEESWIETEIENEIVEETLGELAR